MARRPSSLRLSVRLSVCKLLRKSLLLAGKWRDRHQTFTRWSPGKRAYRLCSRSRSRSSKVTWYAHFLGFLEWATPSLTVWFLPREATRSAVLPWHVVRLSVRLSVRPSVTLRYRDHIGLGSNSWKIISRLISLTISLSADPNMTDLLLREHPQILAGIGVGWTKLSIFDI